MSWALDEPGQGKNLITGRLVRSTEFSRTIKSQGMDAMEALMALDHSDEESWGIEISLGLKSGASGSFGVHPQVQSVMSMDSQIPRRSSSTSSTSIDTETFPRPQLPAAPRRPTEPATRPISPSLERKSTEVTPRPTMPPKRHSTGKKKQDRKKLTEVDPNRPHVKSDSELSDGTSEVLKDLPAAIFAKPESLTKDQAQRLLDSPAFIGLLESLTGQSVSNKRKAEGAAGGSAKKTKGNGKGGDDSNGTDPKLKCYNCGRIKSAVWRQKTMEDGKSVRVCNGKHRSSLWGGQGTKYIACGLYWNKLGQMRPPTMWQGVDEDVKSGSSKKSKTSTPPPAPRMDANGPKPGGRKGPASSSGFKRTLSAVAEKEAQRMTALRNKPRPASSLHQSSRPTTAAMTSPIRGPTPARSLRNTRWNGDAQAGASSPGGWVEPLDPVPQSDGFNPVEESPNTAIRRILGSGPMPDTQSLQMPLSDDGMHGMSFGAQGQAWGTDLSAFFDVNMERTVVGAAEQPESLNRHRAQQSSDDDALSQLFNRTSSMVHETSSPPFDFSQLPPSSPPNMPSDLPHSSLLDSSPDNSPMESPGVPLRRTPRKRTATESRLKESHTPQTTAPVTQPHGQVNDDKTRGAHDVGEFDLAQFLQTTDDGEALEALNQLISGMSSDTTGMAGGSEQDIWTMLQGFASSST